MKRTRQISSSSSDSNDETISWNDDYELIKKTKEIDQWTPCCSDSDDRPITKTKRTWSVVNNTDSDDETITISCKKRKLEDKPYFLMTTDEDNIFHFYGIDTTHKLFPIVIKALKKRIILEKGNYSYNEIALFSIMLEFASFGTSWIDGHYEVSEDSKEAIQDFLGIEKLKESDFTGFLKSEHEGIDLTMKRNLLSSHIVFLQSWC